MKKFIFIIVLVLNISGAFAKEEVEELPPLDPAYVGVHGMVLASQSSSIYASHLPLYHKPHNVQLVYKIDNKDVSLLQLVRDAELVTIKPQPFNLQRLMRGEKLTVMADVYMGHFERDGMLVYKSLPIVLDKLLYVRDFSDLKESSNKQEYDVIKLRKNKRIYIHRIQQAPSYDHLIHIDLEAGCMNKFTTSSAVPKASELLYKYVNCGTMKPLYYEAEDFIKKSH